MNQGKLIVIDAIDGAGKSTAIKAMAEHLKQKGHAVFDLVDFMQTHHRLPEADEPGLAEADVLLSAEPTYCWVGAAVREELIKAHEGRIHDAKAVAEGFSLDRFVLFSRVILPFLAAKPNRWVIQDRGVITSLAYQPLQDPTITQEWLLSLRGNALEISRPPELLLLLRIAPEEAMQRLAGRTEKTDDHVFENATFQEKVAARYRDPSVLAPYTQAGTRIVEIDASKTPQEVAGAVCEQIDVLG